MKPLHGSDMLSPDRHGTGRRSPVGPSRSPSPLVPENGQAAPAEKPSPAIAYRVKTPGQVLHEAVDHEDLDGVTRILQASPDCVDAKNERGRTPLHVAAITGRNDIVKVLLSKGADVDAQSGWKYTPLTFAADSNHPDVMMTLIRSKASLQVVTKAGYTLLHLAALRAKKNMRTAILLLLFMGAELDSLDKNGLTVLQSAVSEGRYSNVQTLCAFGADPAFENPDGKNAFYYTEGLDASLAKRMDHVLKKWAKPGRQMRKILPELSKFITLGGQIDVINMLAWASMKGHLPLVEGILDLFLEENPSIIESQSLERGWKPIHHAARAGQSKVTEILLRKGAAVDAPTLSQKFTPLHLAAEKGRQRTVKVLLDYGANVLAETRHGTTAIQLAELGQHPKTLDILRRSSHVSVQRAGDQSTQDTGDLRKNGEGPSEGTQTADSADSSESEDASAELGPSAVPATDPLSTSGGSFDGALFSVPVTGSEISHSETYEWLLGTWDRFDFKKKYDQPVKVAVLDTGLDVKHQNFKKPRLTQFINGKPSWATHPEPSQYERIKACEDFTISGHIAGKDEMIDLDGHGTQVAELILRLAPRSELYIARICEGDINRGAATQLPPTENPIKKPRPHIVAKAIDWAVEQKVDIINMSFGFEESQKEVKAALNRAVRDSKVLVFSAMSNHGNNSRDPCWPARDPYLTIGVHSCDEWGKRSSGFTPRYVHGSHNFMFVGEQVITQWPDVKGGGFRLAKGTSFAAPAVAAMAALILGFTRQHMCRKEREDAETKIDLDELRELRGMERVLESISEKDETSRYSYIHPMLLWKDFSTSLGEDKSKVRQHAWYVIVESLRR
ncbi:hypothetical protein N8I77_004860 [Diaporthe amygdali]|uniref:Peptidase S8/S53 domain-containing protein n=1 Tax=Phomopsis amygdali TaxID=1214568 RepID=A0AAD9SMX5_PHOAM|nr:hypothetical protein N8I77_004860 [Diaporthe amygdali]